MSERIATYSAFWRYYLREHAKPATRAWHYLGTSLAILCILLALGMRQPGFLLLAVVLGYALAWLGHLISEKNRPATFQYPLWSLYSDFRLFGAWLSGRLPGELAQAGLGTTGLGTTGLGTTGLGTTGLGTTGLGTESVGTNSNKGKAGT